MKNRRPPNGREIKIKNQGNPSHFVVCCNTTQGRPLIVYLFRVPLVTLWLVSKILLRSYISESALNIFPVQRSEQLSHKRFPRTLN